MKEEHIRATSNNNVSTGEHTTCFKTSRFFINRSLEVVTAVLRSNATASIDKYSIPFNEQIFTIRTVYHIQTREQLENTLLGIESHQKQYKQLTPELELIQVSISKALNSGLRTTSICVDHNVNIKLLQKSFYLYVKEVDVMLHLGHYNPLQPHPFSKEGEVIYNYRNLLEQNTISGVFVELVDNDNNVSSRYMYMAKRLIEVPSHSDTTKESGVYVTELSGNGTIDSTYYSYEDSEEALGMYKTKEEAVSGGNPDLINRIEFKRLDEELIKSKQDLERSKNEYKHQELTRKEQIDKLKHDQEIAMGLLKERLSVQDEELVLRKRENDELKDIYDKRKMVRDDYYDRRSHERKDSSELIKYVPAVLVAAIGAIAYMGKK